MTVEDEVRWSRGLSDIWTKLDTQLKHQTVMAELAKLTYNWNPTLAVPCTTSSFLTAIFRDCFGQNLARNKNTATAEWKMAETVLWQYSDNEFIYSYSSQYRSQYVADGCLTIWGSKWSCRLLFCVHSLGGVTSFHWLYHNVSVGLWYSSSVKWITSSLTNSLVAVHLLLYIVYFQFLFQLQQDMF